MLIREIDLHCSAVTYQFQTATTKSPPMSIRFYYRQGRRFKECLKAMEAIGEFEVNPNGAPLGEEPTRHSDFREASCQGWIRFPGLADRDRVCMSGLSLNAPDERAGLRQRWNPQGNSRIHCMTVACEDRLLIPESHHRWESSMQMAPVLYRACKRLFIESQCDEAQALHPSGSVLFNWIRSANFQTVIAPYERGAAITEEEGYSWGWRDIYATEEVFPELSDGGEEKR